MFLETRGHALDARWSAGLPRQRVRDGPARCLYDGSLTLTCSARLVGLTGSGSAVLTLIVAGGSVGGAVRRVDLEQARGRAGSAPRPGCRAQPSHRRQAVARYERRAAPEGHQVGQETLGVLAQRRLRRSRGP